MSNLRLYYYYFLFLSIFLNVSCNSVDNIKSTLPSKINPNSARIYGTIINIEDISESTGPCSKYPCVAIIIVNNVLETGFSSNSSLTKNDTLKVKFEFTLSKTSKELLPELNYDLPGLKVGDSFICDIEKIDLIKSDTRTLNLEYRIYNYDRKN